jgi:hypothetical protein
MSAAVSNVRRNPIVSSSTSPIVTKYKITSKALGPRAIA